MTFCKSTKLEQNLKLVPIKKINSLLNSKKNVAPTAALIFSFFG
jgi:hypothetical protein